MFMEFIRRFNWVDLLILAFLVRIVYSSIQAGIVVELLKLLGALFTVFVCFHYYVHVGMFLHRITMAPAAWTPPVAFLLLWILLFVLCWLIRKGLLMLFTIEAQSFINKWGAVLLGICRFFVVGSMVFFLFMTTGDKYLEKMSLEAFSQKVVLPVAPKIYNGVCDGFVIKLFPAEKINPDVGEQLKKVNKR